MNVTWSALGLSALLIFSLAMIAFGLLEGFAAGMASAPDEKAGRHGCIVALVGVVLLIVSIVGFFL